MQYPKGAPHLLNPIRPFLLRRPKEMDERKGRRCAVLVGRIPRTGFAGCCGRPSCISLRLIV